MNVLLKLAGAVGAGVAVGVFAVGEQEHLDTQALGKQHVDASQRCVDACRVAIVEHGDVIGKTMDGTNLSLGERCATRCHHIFNARLMH